MQTTFLILDFLNILSLSTPLSTFTIHLHLSTYYNTFASVCLHHHKLSVLYIENMARIVRIFTWTHKSDESKALEVKDYRSTYSAKAHINLGR